MDGSQNNCARWERKPDKNGDGLCDLGQFLEKQTKPSMTESSSEVVWGDRGVGLGVVGRADFKGARGKFWGDGYVHCLDCSDGFTGVSIGQS